jgi:hypothetical protein
VLTLSFIGFLMEFLINFSDFFINECGVTVTVLYPWKKIPSLLNNGIIANLLAYLIIIIAIVIV